MRTFKRVAISRQRGAVIAALLLSLLTAAFSLSLGEYSLPLSQIIAILFRKIAGLSLHQFPESAVSIVWLIRLPRVLTGLLVGGALAVSGSVVQALLKNPLASPHTIGASSGAALGAVAVIATGVHIELFQELTLAVVSFAGGLITVWSVLFFTFKIDKNFSNHTLILVGFIFSLFINGVVTLLLLFFQENLQQAVIWQMGSLRLRGWNHVKILLPFVLVGGVGILFHIRELNILAFGEESAHSLGVNVTAVKRRLFLFTALLTGAAVSVAGVIGFIGLVIPHLVRRLVGSNHKYVIPLSFLLGGAFLSLTDLTARSIRPPTELPVGAIAAFLGAPFFLYLYFRER